MEPYDYDVERSLRDASGILSAKVSEEDLLDIASIAAKTAAAKGVRGKGDGHGDTFGGSNVPSSNASVSDAAGSTSPAYPHMSLNTRRRLIRKPLPNLPAASGGMDSALKHASAANGERPTKSNAPSGSTTPIHELPNPTAAATASDHRGFTHSLLFARNEASSNRPIFTLEQAKQRTRDASEKEQAMLEWWPRIECNRFIPSDRDATTSTSAAESSLRLNAHCRNHLVAIVHATLCKSLRFDDCMDLTTAVVSLLEDCFASVTEERSLAALQHTLSVLWRVNALVRSDEQLNGSKGGIMAALGVLGVRWPKLVPWRARESGASEAESEKSIPPMTKRSFSTSSVQTLGGTEQRQRKRDMAVQLLNNAFWMSGAGPSFGDVVEQGDAHSTSFDQALKKKTSSAAPNLVLKAAAPTVALSGQSADVGDALATDSESVGPAPKPERPSMLADRLSMQLRSNAMRAQADAGAASLKTGSMRHPYTRSTSRSSIDFDQREKQAASRLQIATCKICAHFDRDPADDEEEDGHNTIRLSGRGDQATLKGSLKRQRRGENASTMSARSDKTVKLHDVDGTTISDGSEAKWNDETICFRWKRDHFAGEALALNPFSIDVGRKDLEETGDAVTFLGGTFWIHGCKERSTEDAIRRALDIGIYAGLSMLLEMAFLSDFDVIPKGKADASGDKHDDVARAEECLETDTVHRSPEEGSNHLEQQDPEGDKHAQWPLHFWGIFQQSSARDRPQKKRTSHVPVFSRSKTLEGDEDESGSPNAQKALDGGTQQGGRLGKILSSLTGYAQKQNRPASTIAPVQSPSDDSNTSPNDTDVDLSASSKTKASSLATETPCFISPYRTDTSSDKKEDDVDGDDVDYVEHLISRQSLSLVVLEGLGVSLPFSMEREKTKPESAQPTSNDSSRGSTLSVHSSAASTTATSVSGFSSVASTTRETPGDAKGRIDGTSFTEKYRRQVTFYQDGGRFADVSLGQAIEEMAAKSILLRRELTQTLEKGKKDKDKEKGLSDASSHTFKIAQYVCGRDKISVCATMVSTSAAATASEGIPQTAVPRTSDVKDVAAAANANDQVAGSALQLADFVTNTRASEQKESGGAKADQGESAKSAPASANQADAQIQIWHADMRTGRQSVARTMSRATYLASYGAFLEALMENKSFTQESPILIGDTEDDTDALDSFDDPKHDLVRLFKIGEVALKFHVQPISIFDLFIEGPVVVMKEADGQEAKSKSPLGEAEKEADPSSGKMTSLLGNLRLEVQSFFASVKSEISRLEHIFVARELDSFGNTIRPASNGSRLSQARSIFSETDDSASITSSTGASIETGYSGAAAGPLELLARLSSSLRRHEFDLYELLKEEVVNRPSLNDIRRRFHDRARSVNSRLKAWSQKHLTKAELDKLGALQFDEPFYFQKCNHTFPGSDYVLRQDEPLSIIAYSLSSRDFQTELLSTNKRTKFDDVMNWRTSVAVGNPEEGSSKILSLSPSLDKSSTLGAPSVVSSSADTVNLDPDLHEDFCVPEPLKVNMKRKKRTKDIGILSLRVRSSAASKEPEKEAEADPDLSLISNDSADENSSRHESEKSKSEVDESEESIRSDATPSIISSFKSDDNDVSTPRASRIIVPTPSKPIDTISTRAANQFDTVSSRNDTFRAHVSTISPRQISNSVFAQYIEAPRPMAGRVRPSGSDADRNGGQVTKSVLSSSIDSMSEDLTVDDGATEHARLKDAGEAEHAKFPLTPGPRHPSPSLPASPHIKHTIVAGDLKISCLSWFAEDFLKLRQAWGVDHDFVSSLSRSKSWSNVGGKSKSGFYLSGDEKWIAKQLLNVWTVDEKEAFLEFAPAYLRYMMNSVSNDCPTLLVKIAGVYSMKIKDVKTGEVKLKLSVQVLENVFAGDEGGQSIRFDLKGIRDRRAAGSKAAQQQQSGKDTTKRTTSTTDGGQAVPADLSVWWDSEWIEAMQPRAFVPEQDKSLFKRALHNDLAFLTASNVMDYSLLVGVTESLTRSGGDKSASRQDPADAKKFKPTFRVRIVDFLGAWTLVKQLESSSKKAIKSHAPTVLPPHEYAHRFSQAIEGYFTGSPGV